MLIVVQWDQFVYFLVVVILFLIQILNLILIQILNYNQNQIGKLIFFFDMVIEIYRQDKNYYF